MLWRAQQMALPARYATPSAIRKDSAARDARVAAPWRYIRDMIDAARRARYSAHRV